MKTVAFHNLGCKVNAYEYEMMQQSVQKHGWEIVDFAQKADVYVVNTCSVTNIADRKSRQMLHKAKKINPDAIVVATGCYVQTDTEGAMADDAIDIVIGNNHKDEIVQIITDYIRNNKLNQTVDDLSSPIDYENYKIYGSNERTRVDIKIQDGCNQFCSYCIIPYARGRIRSRDVESIVNEISVLAESGFKEVVLTGIHLSSYGLDFHEDEQGNSPSYNSIAAKNSFTNRDLLEVIEKVSAIDGIERIRLGSLEPRVITEEFLESISSNNKVCPHFHLSLQSGCDETLKRMNRRYSAEEFLEKTKLIRKYYKHPALTTDIIVGFPGETQEEFDITCRFVDEIEFYETHIFKYSKRKGTVAATMPGQLTEAQKALRSDVLEEKNKLHGLEFRKALIGEKVEILTEEVKEFEGIKYTVGHTKDYVMMAVEGEYDSNRLLSGVVTGFIRNDIMMLKTDNE